MAQSACAARAFNKGLITAALPPPNDKFVPTPLANRTMINPLKSSNFINMKIKVTPLNSLTLPVNYIVQPSAGWVFVCLSNLSNKRGRKK